MSHENNHKAQTGAADKSKIIIASVVVIAIVVLGTLIFIRERNKRNQTTNNETAQDIRDTFAPEDHTATSTPTTTPEVSAPVAGNDFEPRGDQVQPTVPITRTYTNQTMGIQLTINTNWQANELGGNKVVLTSSSGQNISIQMYQGAEGLETVYEQLTKHSSASNVSWTDYNGQRAISFEASGRHGMATYHKGKLYYIMAPSLNTEPINSLVLL